MGGGGAGGGRERLDSVRATPPAHTPKFPHTSTHPPPPPPSHQVLQGRAPGRGQAAQGQGGVPRDVRRRVMRGVQDVAPRLRQWAARHRIPTIPPPPPSPRKLHCPSPEKTLSLPLNPPTPHPTARPEFAPPTVHHQDPPPPLRPLLSLPCIPCVYMRVCDADRPPFCGRQAAWGGGGASTRASRCSGGMRAPTTRATRLARCSNCATHSTHPFNARDAGRSWRAAARWGRGAESHQRQRAAARTPPSRAQQQGERVPLGSDRGRARH